MRFINLNEKIKVFASKLSLFLSRHFSAFAKLFMIFHTKSRCFDSDFFVFSSSSKVDFLFSSDFMLFFSSDLFLLRLVRRC